MAVDDNNLKSDRLNQIWPINRIFKNCYSKPIIAASISGTFPDSIKNKSRILYQNEFKMYSDPIGLIRNPILPFIH